MKASRILEVGFTSLVCLVLVAGEWAFQGTAPPTDTKGRGDSPNNLQYEVNPDPNQVFGNAITIEKNPDTIYQGASF